LLSRASAVANVVHGRRANDAAIEINIM